MLAEPVAPDEGERNTAPLTSSPASGCLFQPLPENAAYNGLIPVERFPAIAAGKRPGSHRKALERDGWAGVAAQAVSHHRHKRAHGRTSCLAIRRRRCSVRVPCGAASYSARAAHFTSLADFRPRRRASRCRIKPDYPAPDRQRNEVADFKSGSSAQTRIMACVSKVR